MYIYMDGLVREVNVRVLRRGLELLSANDGIFEINQLLVADDTALAADSEESTADQRVLRWFGDVERIDEHCMARRVLMAEVRGGRER